MIKISISKFRDMLVGGGLAVSYNCEYLNELNVFPVPDGDTGTNLKITTDGASSAINGIDFKDFFDLGKSYCRALLMNARGNSGVIFSQIFKGFTSVFEVNQTELSITDIIKGFVAAKEKAYASLTSPIEGTILTVVRVTSEKLLENKNSFTSIEQLFEAAVKYSNEILLETPNFLEELKQAGVVDSGGYGFCKFIEGMNDVYHDKTIVAAQHKPPKIKKSNFISSFDDNNDGFGYCCEFILTIGSKVSMKQDDKEEFSERDFKSQLNQFGDSLVLVVDENLLKVHLHTLEPYKLLMIGAKYGEFNKVKIENMTLQFIENNEGTALGDTYNQKESSVSSLMTQKLLLFSPKIVATVPTQMLQDLFINDLKTDYVINYEINGNPSIQEFLAAFKSVKSSEIILVVDDSNVILAAKHAISLVSKSIKIHLINTNDVASSYIVCLGYNPVASYDENIRNITKLVNIPHGKIAQATKQIKYPGISVKQNDYIGIINKKIVVANKDVVKSMTYIVDELFSSRIIRKKKERDFYLFYGINSEVSHIQSIEKYISEKYSTKPICIKTDEIVYTYHFLAN